MSERERWLDDVTATMERRIAATGARPDFLDVVARARAIDPAAVPTGSSTAAGALAEPEAFVADEPGPPAKADALDEWLDDARAAIERHVEARRHGPTPVLAVRRERRSAWWIAGTVLAAGFALVFALTQVIRVVAMDPAPRPDQALQLGEPPALEDEATQRRPDPSAAPAPARTVDSGPAPSEAMVEPEIVEPEIVESPEPPPTATSADRSPPVAKDLATLASEAQAHWRAGRRDEAERLFARIVARGGRSRAAELAFADLFTLAHQLGDVGAQRRWWQAYLRRFPMGRFADDARAGLCREAARGKREACWTEYLEDFPSGSFREEARAARGEPPR